MLQKSFLKFPALKTKDTNFILEPLVESHQKFYVSLLNEQSVQKTLFRKPRTVRSESFFKTLTAMYSQPPKGIVYILTVKKFLQKIPIGYVKIKLIDWELKSAYISIAITDNSDYRGKGYSTLCYEFLFEYLFSKGFLKFYGRTYEENIATIKLNIRTGFRFIGRQKHFVVSSEQIFQDALFFEKLNPIINTSFKNDFQDQLSAIYRIQTAYNTKGKSITQLEKPINFRQEFKKWKGMKGSYVPRFLYDKHAIVNKITDTENALTDTLESANSSKDTPIDWIQYINRIQNYLQLRKKNLESIDTTQFNTTNKNLYLADLDDSYLTMAERISMSVTSTASRKENSSKRLSTEQVLIFSEEYINTFFAKKIQISLSAKSAAGSVNFSNNKLNLSTLHNYTAKNLAKTLFHESIHLINHLNAYEAKKPLLSIQSTPGANWFQEGLAVYLTQSFFEDTLFPKRSLVSWKLKSMFDKTTVKELYSEIYETETLQMSDKEKDLLIERFWRGINEDEMQYTHRRLQYLPGFLRVSDFLKTHDIENYLWGMLAEKDYDFLFSQFIGEKPQYPLSSLFAMKAKLIELIDATV